MPDKDLEVDLKPFAARINDPQLPAGLVDEMVRALSQSGAILATFPDDLPDTSGYTIEEIRRLVDGAIRLAHARLEKERSGS